MPLPASVLDGTGTYVHVGVIQISWANLIVITLMIVVFLLAVLVPFGHRHPEVPAPQQDPGTEADVPAGLR